MAAIDEVSVLKNLRLFHLRVEYDEENDCLIFDRKLTPGSGPSVYGLTIARYLIKNAKFISLAESIKKRLLHKPVIDIPLKTSRYNRKLIVDRCAICRYKPINSLYKELEVTISISSRTVEQMKDQGQTVSS